MNIASSIGKKIEDGKILKFIEHLIHSTWIAIPVLIIVGIIISFFYAFMEACRDTKRYSIIFLRNLGSLTLFILRFRDDPNIE